MYRRQLKTPGPAFVISVIALFVALGGTTYAATSLPKNSVGTAQLKRGAVTKTKINKKTIARLKGMRGPTGLTGPPGPQGSPGGTGPLGPTSGTSAGSVENVPTGNGAFTPFGGNGTVTLPAPGKVLVEISGTYLIGCSAAGSCSGTVAAFVNGSAVPGAWENLNAPANGEDIADLAVSGIAANVPAGTHTVQLETALSPFVGVTNSENLHLTAVALGNS